MPRRRSASLQVARALGLVFTLGMLGCGESQDLKGDAAKATATGPSVTPQPTSTTSSGVSSKDCALKGCPSVVPPPNPNVSFRKDLLLPLQRNCSDALCHGSRATSGAGFFLSEPSPAAANATEMIAQMVNVPSVTAASLLLIEPGKPERSFLVHKVEGCQGKAGLACVRQAGATVDDACGDTMPQGQRPLCDRERELLQQWIMAGALDN